MWPGTSSGYSRSDPRTRAAGPAGAARNRYTEETTVPSEPFEWAVWKRRVVPILLLFPLITLTVGGLTVGVDSYARAKEYERAVKGTMQGYEGMTREDVDTLRIRAMRHALAAFVLTPFAIVGLAAVLGELAGSDWSGMAYIRCGVLGIACGLAQVFLLRGQIGTMWMLGVFTGAFSLLLGFHGVRLQRRRAKREARGEEVERRE